MGHLVEAKKKTSINCEGEHSTLAMKCKLRKEIMKEKRKQEERNLTYSAVTTFQPQQNQNPTYSAPLITREETLKINIYVAHTII